jgi:phosphatidylserine/phosphatidylglycerophosphate/cardiolipin synthase-like enzyme
MDDRITEAGSDLADVRRAHGTPPWLPSVAHLNQTLGAMRLLEGNDARLLTDFDDQFAAMVAAANAAQRYLYVEYYDLCHDATTAPFFAALGAAVQRGVTVRVLLTIWGRGPTRATVEPAGSSTGSVCNGPSRFPFSRTAAATSGPTCATTASCWSPTATSHTWDPST